MNLLRYPAMSVLLGALTTSASSQSLRIFLAEEGLSDPADPQSAIEGPPTIGAPLIDSAATPWRLYLWGQLSDPEHTWLAATLRFRVTGDLQITDWRILNASFDGMPRWDVVNNGDLEPGGQEVTFTGAGSLVSLTGTRALSGTAVAGGDLHHDPVTNSTLLGWIEVVGSQGDVWVGIASKGIARFQGAQPPGDLIFLGVGDDDDGLRGADFDTFSTLPEARVTGTCLADIDGDGSVGMSDLLAIMAAWGEAGGPADIDGDGIVGFSDLIFLLSAWGPCP